MKKILIVEDALNVVAALKARFEGNGYETLIAGDAFQALNIATHIRIDLIILDISLPRGNGLDLAWKLRSLPLTSSTPLIFVTASKDPELRRKAMKLHAAGLLEKPYDSEELLATARFALGEPFTLPRPPGAARLDVSACRAPAARKKILIIEDDLNIARSLSVRLKNIGYEPRMAHDAINGVSQAKHFRPDLTLLDISMPAGDGFTVAQRLRSVLPNPSPIIFLTASRQAGYLDRAIELGASAYFQKPFVTEQLVASIRKALGD